MSLPGATLPLELLSSSFHRQSRFPHYICFLIMSKAAIPCDGSSCEGEFSIFIGDLAPHVTEADLVKVFRNPTTGLRPGAPPRKIESFMSCTSANIIFDTATGQPKGFAFVRSVYFRM